MGNVPLVVAALMFGGTGNVSADVPNTSATVLTQPVTAIEMQFVSNTNAERWDRDLGVLSINPLLVQVAREHSREMYEKKYFDHISPTDGLRTPMDRYLHGLGHRPTWAYLGENLFYCSEVNPDLGHECLMKSVKHRENILNPKYEQIGVGIYIAPNGEFFVTQMFLAQTD